MKKTSIKKLVLALTSLLLVGILVFCVACQNDPYAGNYQPVTEENREEVAANTTAKLQDIVANAQHVKFFAKTIVTVEENGETSTENVDLTMVVDGNKTRVDMKFDITESEVQKYTATIWIDDEADDTWYKVVLPDETLEGKYDSATATDEVKTAYEYAKSIAPIMALQMLAHFATSLEGGEEYTLYVDGENIKITIEAGDNGETLNGEGYFIFGTDGAFRCKLELNSEKVSGSDSESSKLTSYYFTELMSTTETVTLPVSE